MNMLLKDLVPISLLLGCVSAQAAPLSAELALDQALEVENLDEIPAAASLDSIDVLDQALDQNALETPSLRRQRKKAKAIAKRLRREHREEYRMFLKNFRRIRRDLRDPHSLLGHELETVRAVCQGNAASAQCKAEIQQFHVKIQGILLSQARLSWLDRLISSAQAEYAFARALGCSNWSTVWRTLVYSRETMGCSEMGGNSFSMKRTIIGPQLELNASYMDDIAGTSVGFVCLFPISSTRFDQFGVEAGVTTPILGLSAGLSFGTAGVCAGFGFSTGIGARAGLAAYQQLH